MPSLSGSTITTSFRQSHQTISRLAWGARRRSSRGSSARTRCLPSRAPPSPHPSANPTRPSPASRGGRDAVRAAGPPLGPDAFPLGLHHHHILPPISPHHLSPRVEGETPFEPRVLR